MSASRLRQRGIAVITVLLALAIGMLISSEIIMRVYMGLKRSTNQFNALQAWEYALGGEEWARQQLGKDFEEDRKTGQLVDHLQEDWALPAQTLEIEGGFIEIEIYDLQARFNLNNLVDEQGVANSQQTIVFRRLLQQLGISTVYADMATRWASYDDDAGNEYGNSERPYQAADTQFASISEVRLLKEFPMEFYPRLRPFLAVVPVPVKPNINTASEEVLASLTESVTPEKMRAFIEQRQLQKEGFASPTPYINMMGVQKDDITSKDLSVSSEYFEIRVRAEYNGRLCHLISTVYRNGETGEITLLSRDRSQHFRFLTSSRGVKEDDKDKEDEENDQEPDKSGKPGSREDRRADREAR